MPGRCGDKPANPLRCLGYGAGRNLPTDAARAGQAARSQERSRDHECRWPASVVRL